MTTEPGAIERRDFLKRAAVVAGTAAWTTPVVQSLVTPAFATGTGVCPPGRLARFKYDVDEAKFDSGGAGGKGASWCLPDGYTDAKLKFTGHGSTGAVSVGGKMYKVTVSISSDGKTATVTLPPGSVVEDMQAKAGSAKNGECVDFDPINKGVGVVTLHRKEISFVAGVICLPEPKP